MSFSELLYYKQVRQKDLAVKLGVTQQLISKWCKNRCQPKLQRIKSIAMILDVSVDEVINCFMEK